MRDYQKYWVAYETFAAGPGADTVQWNAYPTPEEAVTNGMVPIWPDQRIAIVPAYLRLSPKAEFSAMVNATRQLGFFLNRFFPGQEGGNGFWYFDKDLRKLGFNSETEE